MNRIAIITGASSGIGREFAYLLDKKGLDGLWLVARREEKLKELASELKTPTRVLPLDVSEKDGRNAFYTLLEEEKPDVRWLVNSAGFGKFAPYDGVDHNTSLSMIETNCSGVVSFTLLALPHMRRGAHIVNMGSASAFQPLPYVNIYGSTKVFVRHYTRALNVELRPRGISATVSCPYWVDTAFFDVAHDTADRPVVTRHSSKISPGIVAEKALAAAEKGRDMSAPGAVNKLQHAGAKLLPQRLVMSVFLKMQGIRIRKEKKQKN